MEIKEMIAIKKGNKNAVILLHEIYGINGHMRALCQKYAGFGYDVYCPDLTGRGKPFSYDRQEDAYAFFLKQGGFDCYIAVNVLLEDLARCYDNIFMIGFSAGATVAWRCAQRGLASGIAGYYGSRIRDYTLVSPKCPVLLAFAENDSFDVHALAKKMKNRENTKVAILKGMHGFADPYGKRFDKASADMAEEMVRAFLKKCKK